MLTMDVFNGDAFSAVDMVEALELVPYKPNLLATLGIFQDRPVSTETIAIEQREQTLALIQTSPRGAPLDQRAKEGRNIRDFRTVRIAKGDTLTASELQNIRAFGTVSELQALQNEITRRELLLRDDAELTHENMRLGAIQGIVTDADGTVIRNWYDEWAIAQAAEIDFDLDAVSPASGAVKLKCNQVLRAMRRAAKGTWVQGRTYCMALCGDTFYDQLTAHSEVRATYLNQQEASSLRADYANVFEVFNYGGIRFANYQGTDDDSATVGIPATKAKFFPVQSNGAFLRALSPGESFDFVNTPGREFYPLVVPDRDRNQFAEIEIYSYPLYVCTRPGMLQRAKNT